MPNTHEPILFIPDDYDLDNIIGTVTDGKANIKAIVIRSDKMLGKLHDKVGHLIPYISEAGDD